MKKVDYWTPGSKYFVSITSTRSGAVKSTAWSTCELVESWDEAFDVAKKFLQGNRFYADTITFFTKPRLCQKCMEHATVPMIFDIAEHNCECLCKIDGTPCGVHTKGGAK